MMIRFKANVVDRSFDGDPEMPLLWYLRDILGPNGAALRVIPTHACA